MIRDALKNGCHRIIIAIGGLAANDGGMGKQAAIKIAVTKKGLRDKIAEDKRKVGHCAAGYIDGDVPKAADRKENRVFYVE